MIFLQILIGLFAAVGIGCILADLMKVPTMKASKAANNLGKKGDKKTSIIEIYLKEFATKLSEKIKLNEYKKAQLEADLRTAGMDISPEMYVSNAIVKSVAIGLLATLYRFCGGSDVLLGNQESNQDDRSKEKEDRVRIAPTCRLYRKDDQAQKGSCVCS